MEMRATQILDEEKAPLTVLSTSSGLEWSEEEIALRNWTWGPFEPDESLLKNLAALSEVSWSMMFRCYAPNKEGV